MIPILLIAAAIISLAVGGSPCPPRTDIYPCTCTNVQQTKVSASTIVTCSRLENTDSLYSIFPNLRSMEIDKFYLYDSFWNSRTDEQKHLPSNWIALMKIKEFEIVDTTLSSCFACQWTLSCRNTITHRFKVSNSSSSDKLCILCDNGRGSKQSWTGCMSNLTEFHFNHGKLNSLGIDVFPIAMRNLATLNLAHNQINKIDPNALRNLPQLKTLDLSHNAIEFIDHIFGVQASELVYLDISWNFIKNVGTDIFPAVPKLKILNASSNEMIDIKENVWNKLPSKLKNIDLNNNPFHCDCNIRWINSTFHVSLNLRATCSTPEDYEHTPLRRASRFLTERCDAGGTVGSRKRKPKAKATTPRG